MSIYAKSSAIQTAIRPHRLLDYYLGRREYCRNAARSGMAWLLYRERRLRVVFIIGAIRVLRVAASGSALFGASS